MVRKRSFQIVLITFLRTKFEDKNICRTAEQVFDGPLHSGIWHPLRIQQPKRPQERKSCQIKIFPQFERTPF